MPVRLPKSFGGKAPHKYKAVRTHLNGLMFDSKAEAAYYGQLLMREQAGEVRNIRTQPGFYLMTPVFSGGLDDVNQGVVQRVTPLGRYDADFMFEERRADGSWGRVIAEVKGVEVPLQRWKRLHFERQYDVVVRMIRTEQRKTRKRRQAWQSDLQKRFGKSATGISKPSSRRKSASS